MRILGVDPGLTRCGLGVVDAGPGRSLTVVAVETARSDADASPDSRIAAIAGAVEAALDDHQPDAVALERVFAQHNVRSVMGTAQISGVVLREAARRGIPVATYTPSEVKAAVTGNGRAAKAQVGTMVARVLGLPEVPKPADAADALAIAICHAWKGAAGVASAARQPTAAQQAWAQAEQAARRSRG